MSQDLIDDGQDKNNIVMLGDKLPVSMKLVQSMYNEITGKTESIGRVLGDDHEIRFEDIQQLNYRINQLLEQYNVVEKNCSVTLYHTSDTKEQFSSFERFSLYEKGSMSPCENIRIEYDILLCLPATRKPQSYKIKIDLHSRAALSAKAKSESLANRRIIRMVSIRTGLVEVEYVDYVVARNLMGAINEWYEGVKKNEGFWGYERLQEYSHTFPMYFSVLSIFVMFCVVYMNSEKLVGASSSLHELFLAITCTFFASIFVGALAWRFGGAFENLVDMYSPASGLRLNKGDDEVFKQHLKSNSGSIIAGLFFVLVTIGLNLLSSYLFLRLGISGLVE